MGMFGDDDDRDERNERRDQKEYALLIEIRNGIRHIERYLRSLLEQQRGFIITQFNPDTGEFTMAITGIVAGGVGTFQETPTPPGAVIPAGSIPQWSTSDAANTSLTPSADGTSVAVAVAAATTITSFVLTVMNQDGTFPTPTTIPVLPPKAPAQTGFAVDQVS